MSPGKDQEYFADGLAEELLNALAKIPELRVTGRTSSFQFKGKNEDLRVIGQKLNVATLLEGSVRKAGSRVRITVQLVKAADGFHLWSETYDRQLEDIFAVQDEIARSVSSALKVTLLGGKAGKPAPNAEAYNLVLEARHLLKNATEENRRKARVLLEDVLERDPKYAEAWVDLAIVHMRGFEQALTLAAKQAGPARPAGSAGAGAGTRPRHGGRALAAGSYPSPAVGLRSGRSVHEASARAGPGQRRRARRRRGFRFDFRTLRRGDRVPEAGQRDRPSERHRDLQPRLPLPRRRSGCRGGGDNEDVSRAAVGPPRRARPAGRCVSPAGSGRGGARGVRKGGGPGRAPGRPGHGPASSGRPRRIGSGPSRAG